MVYWSKVIRSHEIFWSIGIRIDGQLEYKDQVVYKDQFRWYTGV